MAKVLRLTFNTSMGKRKTINVQNPTLPVNPAAIKTAMETIITEDVFYEDLASIHSADLYERVVEDIVLPG